MTDSMNVFNRRAVRLHRDRAAKHLEEYDFLFAEVAERLADRLSDIKRRFPLALELGCRGDIVAGLLDGRGGIETLIQSDLSLDMAKRASGPTLALDEEFLPFTDGRFDLIISNLNLHWVNDLPGALMQIRKALKPDGLLLASMFGNATLPELREALQKAEIEVEGGLSPRTSPFATVQDIGGLLLRAGFALPVVDSDMVNVSYGDPLRLMNDLRGMGESNAVNERRKSVSRRETLFRAAEIYREIHGNEDGRVPASFEVIFLTAWTPDPTKQQQPIKPGSAEASLAEALGVTLEFKEE